MHTKESQTITGFLFAMLPLTMCGLPFSASSGYKRVPHTVQVYQWHSLKVPVCVATPPSQSVTCLGGGAASLTGSCLSLPLTPTNYTSSSGHPRSTTVERTVDRVSTEGTILQTIELFSTASRRPRIQGAAQDLYPLSRQRCRSTGGYAKFSRKTFQLDNDLNIKLMVPGI
jgi:hypothetical protein